MRQIYVYILGRGKEEETNTNKVDQSAIALATSLRISFHFIRYSWPALSDISITSYNVFVYAILLTALRSSPNQATFYFFTHC